ncbi:MAG: hypothetical protein ABFD52_12455 [Acidobacteriota bacterium]
MTKRHLSTIAAALGILVFAAVAASAAPADPKPFLGNWKGTLSIAGAELEIGLNFSLDEAKNIKGTFDSITQNAMGIELGKFEIKGRAMTFVIDNPNVPGSPAFKATVDETGKKMTGDFTQSGYAGTFSVEKQ